MDDELENEINEILAINHIEEYTPSCVHCKYWVQLEHSGIGQCKSSKFIINPVYVKGKDFFCSDFYYKKNDKKNK